MELPADFLSLGRGSCHCFSVFSLFMCRNFGSMSGPEILSSSVATFIPLSRHHFFIQCLNRIFPIAIISVAIGYFMSRQRFCLLIVSSVST